MNNVTTSLTYNGQDLTQFVNSGEAHDSVVIRRNIDRRPQRRVTKILIPGRDGAEYKDDDILENVIISYTFVFSSDYTNCDDLVNFLLAQNGFNRLEDQYDLDTYRMARVSGVLDPQSPDNEKGYLVVNFECKPYRWLKPTTEHPLIYTITDSAVHEIDNPTFYRAKPLIEVYGKNGEVKIRNKTAGANVYKYSFAVDNDVPSIQAFYVDSDREDCYTLTGMNLNANVTFTGTSHDYPVFEPPVRGVNNSGVVQISKTGDITKIIITPRWRKV